MGKFLANIKEIQTVDTLNIVTFDFFGNELKMMSLELDSTITKNTKVLLGVKPTSVALAKEFSGEISFSNKLQGEIVQIDMGELLCNVKIEIANIIFESMITKKSAQKMQLALTDQITVFIKASELSILEVYDD